MKRNIVSKLCSRSIALILALIMVLSALPISAIAQEMDKAAQSGSIREAFDPSKAWNERVYTKEEQDEILEVLKMSQETTAFMTKNNGGFYPAAGFAQGGNGDWSILAVNRAPVAVRQDVAETYIANMKNAGVSSPTDAARTVVALASLNQDPTNFNNTNFFDSMQSMDAITTQGINAACWVLIAANCGNYSLKGNVTVDKLLDFIFEQEIKAAPETQKAGGWSYGGGTTTTPQPDMTSMVLVALAPYASKEHNGEKVQDYIDRALENLDAIQKDNGAFGVYGSDDSESVGWVLTGLTAVGKDPLSCYNAEGKQLFVSDSGKTLLDAFKLFYVKNGGFKHTEGESGINGMATYQGAYNMAAYLRYLTGQKALFDYSDVAEKRAIDISEVEGGKITVDKTEGASQGETVKITVTPDEGYTYIENSLTVLQKEGNIAFDEAGHLTYQMMDSKVVEPVQDGSFIMPKNEVRITAQFKKISEESFLINIGSFEHGTVNADKTEASEDEKIILTVSADDGWHLSTLDVKDEQGVTIDVTKENNNIYSFVMPKAAVTVTASFTDEPAPEELREILNDTLKGIKAEIPNPSPMNDLDNQAVFVVAGLRGTLYDGSELGDMDLDATWEELDSWCRIWIDNVYANKDYLKETYGVNWSNSQGIIDPQKLANLNRAFVALGINPTNTLATPIENSANKGKDENGSFVQLTGEDVANILSGSMAMYQQQYMPSINTLFWQNKNVPAMESLSCLTGGFGTDGRNADLDTTVLMMEILGYGGTTIQSKIWPKYNNGDIQGAIDQGAQWLKNYKANAENTAENAKILTALNSHEDTAVVSGSDWMKNMLSNYVDGQGFKQNANDESTDIQASILAAEALASTVGVTEEKANNIFVLYDNEEISGNVAHASYPVTGVYLVNASFTDMEGNPTVEGIQPTVTLGDYHVVPNAGNFVRIKSEASSFDTSVSIDAGYVFHQSDFSYTLGGGEPFKNSIALKSMNGVLFSSGKIEKGYEVKVKDYDLNALLVPEYDIYEPNTQVTIKVEEQDTIRLTSDKNLVVTGRNSGTIIPVTKADDTTFTFTMPEEHVDFTAPYETKIQMRDQKGGSIKQAGITIKGSTFGDILSAWPGETVVLPAPEDVNYTASKNEKSLGWMVSSKSDDAGNWFFYEKGLESKVEDLPKTLRPMFRAQNIVFVRIMSAERNTANAGNFDFYTSDKGEYWVETVNKGEKPSFVASGFDIAVLGAGKPCEAGRNHVEVKFEDPEAKDVYVLVKNESGETNLTEMSANAGNATNAATSAARFAEVTEETGRLEVNTRSSIVLRDYSENLVKPGELVYFYPKSDRGIYAIPIPDTFKIVGVNTGTDYTSSMQVCEGSVEWKDSYLKVLNFNEFEDKSLMYTFIMPDEPVTMEYKTMAATYVTWDMNGVDAEFNYKAPGTYPVQYAFPLPPNPVDKTGRHEFLGWNVTKSATSALPEDQVLVPYSTSSMEVKFPFYAIWKLKPFAVVEEQIDALPEILTLLDEKKVNAANEAYKALAEDQKVLVSAGATEKLEKALKIIEALKQAEAEQKEIQAVIEQIANIGEISDYSQKEKVEAARTAYEQLTDSQKEKVTNLDFLEAAEKKIHELRPVKKLILDVEKFTIGQGFLIEPEEVEFQEGDKMSQILDRYLADHGYSYTNTGSVESSFYLAAIVNADSGTVSVPEYITTLSAGMVTTETITQIGNAYDNNALGEFAYWKDSGWMYTQNNKILGYGLSDCYPEENDVVRIQISLYGHGEDISGRDFGGDESNVEISDKDALIAIMAQAKAFLKTKSADTYTVQKVYDEAKEMVQNAVEPQEQINLITQRLKDALDGKLIVDQAVEHVITQINNLPPADTLTLDDKDAVDAAKNDYDALTNEQKSKVTNVDILEIAMKKITELQAAADQEAADKEAAAAVKKQIEDLGEITSLDQWKDVQGARTAYEALTDAQKAYVSAEIIDTLKTAEDAIKVLKQAAEDQIVAQKVVDMIEILGEITSLDQKKDIQTVRNAYETLTDAQKIYVSNINKLEAAEKAIVALELDLKKTAAKAEIEGYKDMADYREAQRRELAQIIENARKAIDQAVEVINVDQAVAEAKTAMDLVKTNVQLTQEEDQTAAQIVIDQINSLGKITSLNQKEAVKAAREAYNALNSDQRSYISAETLKVLTEAEGQIKKLEAAANQPESTPTPQPTSALTPGDGSGSGSETGSNARTGIAVESVGMVAGITLFVIGICLAGALGIQRRRKS